MADTKISALTAVATPAGTDEFAVNQGGTSKKETLAQIHTNDAHAGYTDHAKISSPASPAAGSGRLYAIDDDGTTRYEYKNSNGDVVRLARDNILTVRNNTGSTLSKGDWVYISGANSQKIRVAKARADDEATAPAVGMIVDTITNGSDGRCLVAGLSSGHNTSGYTDGDPVYLSNATAGAMTATVGATGFKQRVGFVVYAHATLGVILVAPVGLSSRLLPYGNGIVFPGVTSEPPTPAAGFLNLYARSVGGRMMLKQMGPSGLDTVMQPAIFQNRVLMYVPSTGTTGTGSGTGLGPLWTSGGTVSHPTPASTAPALANQMRRTRYANVVTTTDQTLGIKAAAADTLNYWRGNAAGLGGFFYAARFIVELWPAATVRIFAGLTASSATYVVASNTVLNNTCGLWHDTTDPASGANSFNLVTRDATATTKTSIALTNAIIAGNAYDFYMFCAPNGTTIYARLDDIVNNVTYEVSATANLPVNTVFMGPQCAMSNGTANVTVTTSAIGIAGVYTEADR